MFVTIWVRNGRNYLQKPFSFSTSGQSNRKISLANKKKVSHSHKFTRNIGDKTHKKRIAKYKARQNARTRQFFAKFFYKSLMNCCLIFSIRFRFTPMSEYPIRDAERTSMIFCSLSKRNSTSSVNRNSLDLHSARM